VKKRSVFWPEMTRPEVEALIRSAPVAILPLGATEAYGLHMPCGSEAIIAEGIARRVGERTQTLVAPVLNFGWAEWLSAYAGSIVIPQETTTLIIRGVAENLVRQGIRSILFLNAHSGHVDASHVVARDLHRQHGTACAAVEVYSLAPRLAGDVIETKTSPWGHGSEGPTSLVLALAPDLVDMERARPDVPKCLNGSFQTMSSNSVRFEESHINFYQHFHEITETGIIGDPTGATREKGEEVVRRLVDYLSRVVEALKRG
jgi:creatinine amidohydrolase